MRRFLPSLILILWTHQAAMAVTLDFVKDCYIPTGTMIDSYEIGGLSALTYRKKSLQLVALSDFKRDTDAQLFMFILHPDTNCPFPIMAASLEEEDEDKVIQKTAADAEGLAFDVDGSFFVSSEMGNPNQSYQTLARIMTYSNNALKESDIETPATFEAKMMSVAPYAEPKPIPRPSLHLPILQLPVKPKMPNWKHVPPWAEKIAYWIQLELWQEAVKEAQKKYDEEVAHLKVQHALRVKEVEKINQDTHQAWVDGHREIESGFQHNAGFESLSFDQESRILSLMNEAPLQQDRDVHPGLLRLIRMKVDKKKKPVQTLEHSYQLDPNMRVSEILDLGKGRLLVLEIYYDTGLHKVFSKIYEVNVDDSKGRPSRPYLETKPQVLEKKLVLDLNTLQDKLDPSFGRLDNLEGMTLGPLFKTGEKSLILVSDNNRSRGQSTQFLIFKLQDQTK